MLVLFDLDGTLLVGSDPLYRAALVPSVREVWGHELTDATFARRDHLPGETAVEGLRKMLTGDGLDPERVDEGLAHWCRVFGARYVEVLLDRGAGHFRCAPGAVEALTELARDHEIALLTGNPEPMARARIERLGLVAFFPDGSGAFGCDAEHREELIAIARGRAGGCPASDTVLVGDTPLDIEGAHAAGGRAVAVTQGAYGAAALAAADAVIGSLPELPAAIGSLAG